MTSSGEWWNEHAVADSDGDAVAPDLFESRIEITRWRSLTDAHGTRDASTWSEIAEMLAAPAPRPADAENPKLPGWSPATFRDDRRAKDRVEHVTALVLDVDAGSVSLERVREAFDGRRAIVHSTRRYAPETPRWRVVAAVSRAMSAAEHASVWSRERDRLAQLGIALDEQTKDPSRFWFAPCEPLSGAYVVEALDGDCIDVDAAMVCVAHEPVAPSSEASVSSSAVPAPNVSEPSEVASISMSTRKKRAAAWLKSADVAISGQGGHATTMRVATAVVRGFALTATAALDVLAREWNARCDPPWSPSELAHKVEEAGRVGNMAHGAKLVEGVRVSSVAATTDGATAVADKRTMGLLDKKNGKPRKQVGNVLTIFRRDPRWRDIIAYDAFREAPILLGQPPQREHDALPIVAPAEWASQDSTRAAAWLFKTYELDVSAGMVTEAMLAAAQHREVHPVREYFASLTWDGVARVDAFFAAYCGTVDTEYTRGVARLLFLSAVARVFRPGCKVDTIPIIEGPQGTGKSSALSALAGAWFADTPLAIGDKDAYQALRGVWIYELAELAALKGRDATRIKSFASSPADHYRPSYEQRARSVARQCIFVGTTNEAHYLTDATGARRFWPVRISSVDLAALRRDRDQLWAESHARFDAGEDWWPSKALERLGAAAQDDRYEGDPWEAPLVAWLSHPVQVHIDAEHRRHEVPLDPSEGLTVAEVLTYGLGLPIDRQGKREQTRVTEVLRNADWTREKHARRVGGARVRKWFPPVTPSEGDTGSEGGDGDVPGSGDT